MIDFLASLPVWQIYFVVVFLMFTNGLFLFPSSQMILIGAGALSVMFGLNFYLMFFLIWISNLLGNYALYLVAFYWGEETAKKLIPLSKKSLDNDILLVKYLFKHYDFLIILIGRNLPVFHSLVSIPAGVSKVSHKRFLFYTGLGIFTWNLMFFLIGFYFGNNYDDLNSLLNIVLIIVTVLISVVSVWLIVRYKKRMLKKAKDENKMHLLG